MATLYDEEQPLAGLSNLGDLSGLSGLGGLSGLSGLGTGKKNDPLATSWDNFKIGFGGGLQTLDDLLEKDGFLSSWGEALERSGEIGKEDYQSAYDGGFTEQEGWDKLGFALEKALENAAGSGAVLATAILGAFAAPAAGGTALATAARFGLRKGIPIALSAFLNLDDVASTHVSKNNKPVSDYNAQEKINLAFTTAMVTALDWLVPGKIAKGFGGKPLNVGLKLLYKLAASENPLVIYGDA